MGVEESAAAASVVRSEHSIFPSPPKEVPWLVIPYGKSGTPRKQAFYNIMCDDDPNDRRKACRKSIPELIATTYIQKPSHQGWLIIICDDDEHDYSHENRKYGDCFLWNPATLETIPLPSLLEYCGSDHSTGYHLVDCVLSSAPPSSNSMVMLVYYVGGPEGHCELVFLNWFPGDGEWRKQKWYSETIPVQDMQSLLYFNRRFYLMCNAGEQELVQNIAISVDWDFDRDCVFLDIKTIGVRGMFSYPLLGGKKTSCLTYDFVATSDELYCIQIIYSTLKGFRKVVIQIVVLRLDFDAMAWKVVYSIGDRVLFLGSHSTTSACCSTAEMGLSRGCLYYTLPDDQCLHKYDIESSGNTVIVPCLNLPKQWKDPEFIMMPNQRKQKGKRKRGREEDIVDEYECKKKLIKTKGCRTDAVFNRQDDNIAGHFEKAHPWGILNDDMVECIANCLHRLDYIHLRSVCKSYRALLPMVKFTSNSVTRGTYLSPWLMFNRDHSITTFNLINPMHNNESYLLNLSDLVRTVIRFQKGGWLLVSMENNQSGLFFYNPFTRDTISLPELPVHFTFSSVSFSSLPTSSDCVVFAIEQGPDCQVSLYFIRKGEAFWSSRHFTNTNTELYSPSYNTPVFYNGVLYSVDYNGSLGVFNINDYSWKVLEKPHQPFDAIYPSFLVKCDEELLLVKMGCLGTLVGIFRLDFSCMDWVKIENLGKHMLFVSYTSCFSAIAPPSSRMENKVYFPRLCMNGEGVLFYCLETGSYRSFGSRHSATDFSDTEGWHSNCIWIEPNWSKFTDQELDWDN